MNYKTLFLLLMLNGTIATAEDNMSWYVGDTICQPPPISSQYSPPYNSLDHPDDYPIFEGADKQGWFCSYQCEDGTVVQFGDSRTPQEQWLSVWGINNDTE